MESRKTRRQRYLNHWRLFVGTIAAGVSVAAKAATVTFAWTNYDGSVLTNDLIVSMVSPQPYSDGTYVVIGLPKRFPTTNGAASRYLLAANYSVVPYDPRGLLNIVEPVIFAVPNSTNTYNFWRIRISGGNTYNYSPGVRTLTAGANTTVVDDGQGNLTVSAATNVTTSFATNAGNITAATLTNQMYSSNVVGAFPEVRHATNSDQSLHATNADYITLPTLTNKLFGSNIIGALTESLHATNADFVAGTITNRHYGSNTIGSVSEAAHSTNSDNVTLVTLTNKLYGSNITGAAAQATHATNADNVTGTLTNLTYGSNLVGSSSQSTHATNADFVLLSTLTNRVYGTNLVGAAPESTHTTNADNVTAVTLTNKMYGSNIIGSLTSTVVTASFVTQPTLTNQVTNFVGAIAQAAHATNSDNVTLATLTNKTYSSNLVGAANEAAHATNADNVTLSTLTNKTYSSNLLGAAAQSTHATNSDNVTAVTLTNQVYGSNVIGIGSATNSVTSTYVTVPTLTNKAYTSNLLGAISEATHATNSDNVTAVTLTNKTYSSNLVGAAAQAAHATNADISTFVSTALITNQVYGSNIQGTVSSIAIVTNSILTNRVYGSNLIGSAAQVTHATNADYVTLPTLTNQIYGSNLVGFPTGPIQPDTSSPVAPIVDFGVGEHLMYFDDDNARFYLANLDLHFLFNGDQVTNIQANNIAGTVSNALRSVFANFATNAANPTNAFLTNQIYGSNIVGAVPAGVNLAAYVTNSPLTNTLYGSNIIGSVVLNTNSFATNLTTVVNKTVTNLVRNGHYKIVRSDGVVFLDADGAGILSLPNGFSGAVDGGQVNSGVIGIQYLGTGVTDASNFLRADGAFAQVPGTSISSAVALANLATEATHATNADNTTLVNGAVLVANQFTAISNPLPSQSDRDVGSSLFSAWVYAGTLFSKGTGTDPDAYNIRCSTVLKMNGKLFVYYAGNNTGDGANTGSICCAVGPDFQHLVKIGVVIAPTGNYSNHIQGPRIYSGDLPNNGKVYMAAFGGTNGTPGGFEQITNDIFLFASSDGTNWTAQNSGSAILKTANSAWAKRTLWRPFIMRNSQTYYMFYNGDSSALQERIGFATATNILGPWTEYSGNPVISSTDGGLNADPSILRCRDGSFAMMFNGSDTGIKTAWSTNLTNWTYSSKNFVRDNPGINGLAGPEVFEDDGLCLLWDDTVNCYIGRMAESVGVRNSNTRLLNLETSGAALATRIRSPDADFGGVSIVAGYAPTQDVALHVWYDASKITGFPTVGTFTNWADLSGNGLNATNDGNLPGVYLTNVFNHYPVVRLSSASLKTASTTLNTAMSFVAVIARPWTTASFAPLFSLGYAQTSGKAFLTTAFATQDWATKSFLFVGDGYDQTHNPRATGSYGALADLQFILVSGVLGAGGSHIWTNGTLCSTTEGVGVMPSLAGTLELGSAQSAGNYGDYYVAEFFIVDSSLADTLRQKFEGYGAHKWGLSSYLPAGHPYKYTFGHVHPEIIGTNLISGFIYTNFSGSPMLLTVTAALTEAVGTAGHAELQLRVNNVAIAWGLNQTTATSLVDTNNVGMFGLIPCCSTYTLTNTSDGAGNSATTRGGQLMVY